MLLKDADTFYVYSMSVSQLGAYLDFNLVHISTL